MPPAATSAPSTPSAGSSGTAFGEIIGVSNADWGGAAVDHIYSMWKASAPHAAIMFSRGYNYIGIGYAYRASNGTTWASVVFADSKDHTAPKAEKHGKGVSGRTVTFHWTGHDRKLQTHLAGLADFDVQVPRRPRRLAHGPEQHDPQHAHAQGPVARPLVRLPGPGRGPAR